MADPTDDERAPLLRNTSEPSFPPAYSAYGDEGGIRKTNSQIPVSMFNNLTALTVLSANKIMLFPLLIHIDLKVCGHGCVYATTTTPGLLFLL